MAPRPSALQRRVTWAMTGTLAVFLVVMSLLARAVFDRMEDDLVDSVLAAQVDALREGLAQGHSLQTLLPARSADGGQIQAWLMPAGNHAPPPGVVLPTGDARDVTQAGRTWHVWVESVPQGTLYVRYDATTHESRVRLFDWLLLAGAGLTLLCAWWVARRLARRVVAPIREVSARLATWGDGEAATLSPAGDEAAQLIEAFNRLQDRVDRAIAIERRFSANLSHELRTPLAALRSDCEIALLDAGQDSPLAARLQRMMAQVDAAASSLSGAVAFNRADPVRVQEVDVRQVLEEAWFALRPMAQARQLELDNRIPAGRRQRLDPYALLIVMRNLLRNAIEHAAPATLTVRWEPENSALVFQDDGPGLAADRLAEWQEWRSGRADLATSAAPPRPVLPVAVPGYRATAASASQLAAGRVERTSADAERSGHGLGLGIARHVCELQGWRLVVESSGQVTPGWTRFTLVLSRSTA